MIFNTHTHVNCLEDYQGEILKCQQNGVSFLLAVGYDFKSSLEAIELARKYPFIYASVGVHPCEILNQTEDVLAKIEYLLRFPKVVALGEVGLDYHYQDSPSKEKQQEFFIKCIYLANKYHKPLVVHMRDATNDTYEILKKHKLMLHKGIMHCYSGSYEYAIKFIELGFYISFAGPLTYKNATNLKEMANLLPSDKILVETDDPYLPPASHRGKTNSPSLVTEVVEELARIRNISYEEACMITMENAKRLFNL